MKMWPFLAFVMLCPAGGVVCAGQAAEPVRVILLTGETDLPYHVWQETTPSIRAILENSGRFVVRLCEEPRGINRAALDGYQVLVLNYNGPRFPREEEAAIEEFVRRGGGLVAFHQASYGAFFGQIMGPDGWAWGEPGSAWSAFAEMIGASWEPKDIGHARRTVFEVKWLEPGHPIVLGLPESFMANDELYHKLKVSPGVRVLADALSPVDLGGTGKREPLVWTNRFGDGRIFFTTLGHDAMAWHEPGMANLLARGVEWAATGEVTIRPVTREKRMAGEAENRLLAVTGGHSYPVEFYAMLESLPGVDWHHATNQAEAFSRSLKGRYDVVLLHDLQEEASSQTRECLKEYLKAGGGVIELHHAIVDYSDWPWWYEEVIGGKYFVKPMEGHPASHFKEGVEFLVTPVEGKEKHPVLSGVGPLWVHDELYKGMYHSPKIEVLMQTSHPDNDPPVVYVGPYREARVLYIQLGHSADTMRNPGFRKLLANSVRWVSKRSTNP